ncbi:MAG: site-specific DNA-methyltransferase [Proteobacteria bacterium]|nr:site-specific DNA-methyltransferase [Pseudomonadota bacterium]
MSRLTDLIAQARSKDPQMGADLEREFQALSSRLPFGLNFERHRPEAVELAGRPVRKSDKVRVLPERGSTRKGDSRLWRVRKIDKARNTAELELLDAQTPSQTEAALDDLIVVAEFRDTIYPGLKSTGRVSRGGDKPCHTVINGENYHVLKALTWTHCGKVDAIYIDPPYNTGAKDWKYNNDYVEADDLYRHSKWLAMMERRLKIAKELLNPADSVLIVTIDEKEYLRLGLLLEQVFTEARIQMVSSVISPKGSARRGLFSRADEYIFFALIGDAYVGASSTDMLRQAASTKSPVRWKSLLRSAGNGLRTARPNLFYPLFFDETTGAFIGAGEILTRTEDRSSIRPPIGSVLVWPLGEDGRELTWSLGRESMLTNLSNGYVRFGPWNGISRTPYYLTSGQIRDIESNSGLLTVLGRDSDGALELAYGEAGRQYQPLTVWNRVSHSATEHGTGTVKSLLPNRNFPFPKSLYAVEDALRFFVANKPEAVVLDFFSGSGTTAHAVMRLNKQDGGCRQCISVTNNEVGADEQKTLREQGLRPGDAEWERLGICDYITKPRVQAAITGKTPDGTPINGNYKFTDEFPMADGFAENAEFFTLTYETPVGVSYQTAFAHIAPLLWLRAGSCGRRIEKLPAHGWDVADTYGLLVELDAATDFLKAARKAKELRIAYIVTDDERRFQALARRLPQGVEAIRLYESYLTNFAFANGDDA